MPSSKKMKRILELNEQYDLDYFNNETHKETIEFILMDEFPEEIDREEVPVEKEQINNDYTIAYWIIGTLLGVFFLMIFWKQILGFLLIVGVIAFFGFKFLGGVFSGVSSSTSSSSYSHTSNDHVTYGLQRKSRTGGTWLTIARGPETFMIDMMDRQTDDARYRVVMLVNGKVSGTTYS